MKNKNYFSTAIAEPRQYHQNRALPDEFESKKTIVAPVTARNTESCRVVEDFVKNDTNAKHLIKTTARTVTFNVM